MKKVIFLKVILFTYFISFGQFYSEIDSLTKKGHFFIGTFSIDSIIFCKVSLEKNIDLEKVKSFYIVLVSNDTTVGFTSGGGQNNFLWTNEIKKITIKENKIYALIDVFWEYREERFRNQNNYIGSFTVRIEDKKTRNRICDFSIQLRSP